MSIYATEYSWYKATFLRQVFWLLLLSVVGFSRTLVHFFCKLVSLGVWRHIGNTKFNPMLWEVQFQCYILWAIFCPTLEHRLKLRELLLSPCTDDYFPPIYYFIRHTELSTWGFSVRGLCHNIDFCRSKVPLPVLFWT